MLQVDGPSTHNRTCDATRHPARGRRRSASTSGGMSGGITGPVVGAWSVYLQHIRCKCGGQRRPPPGQDVAVDVTDLDLETRLLAGLPIVNAFYDRLGIDRLLETHVPDDPRLRLSPAAALGVVIRNLVVRHAPVYALGEWASRYEPSQVGLT